MENQGSFDSSARFPGAVGHLLGCEEGQDTLLAVPAGRTLPEPLQGSRWPPRGGIFLEWMQMRWGRLWVQRIFVIPCVISIVEKKRINKYMEDS